MIQHRIQDAVVIRLRPGVGYAHPTWSSTALATGSYGGAARTAPTLAVMKAEAMPDKRGVNGLASGGGCLARSQGDGRSGRKSVFDWKEAIAAGVPLLPSRSRSKIPVTKKVLLYLLLCPLFAGSG